MNRLKILRYVILVLGLALVIIGIVTGDYINVFRKATKICFECIGIG